ARLALFYAAQVRDTAPVADSAPISHREGRTEREKVPDRAEFRPTDVHRPPERRAEPTPGGRVAISRNARTRRHHRPPLRKFGFRTGLRVNCASVVGSRRLLTHMCAPGRKGAELGEAMRFRGKSIRRKIVALLLVPLLSLTTIWAFATVLTGREASHLFDVSSVMEEVGYPIEDTVRVLQQERRQTLVHLADPRASDGLAALRRSRAATDKAVGNVRANVAKSDVREAMGEDTEDLSAVLDSFDGIESLRRSVEDGTVDRAQALDLYNQLVDPCYILLANLHVVDDVSLDKQYRALVNLARARELLSREDALLGSALIVGRLSRAEVRQVSDLVAQRSLLYDASLPQLPGAERDRYVTFWKNASSAPLRVGAEAAVSSGTAPPRGISAKSWDTAAGTVLEELGSLNDQAVDRYQDRVRPVAMGVITQAVVAGVLGLIALLLSLFLSVRVGRGLIRDLRQLRLEALEASGVRLPGVMRRLSAGEQVDVETEVPRLEYDKNEIGEVGQALNTLHR